MVLKLKQTKLFNFSMSCVFSSLFFRGATEMELDSNSRLLFPRTMLEHAQIDRELILFAYFDKIEVWSKENYEALMDDEPMDFDELAEEVMGSNNKYLKDEGTGIS